MIISINLCGRQPPAHQEGIHAMRDIRLLTLTMPLLLAAGCAQAEVDADDELGVAEMSGPAGGADGPVLEPFDGSDADQGCVGEIFPVQFTSTTARASGTVNCLQSGRFKFKACIRRRLIQSVGAKVFGLLKPIWVTAPALVDEIRGVQDCVEKPEMFYSDPPLQLVVMVDVFCGRQDTRYSYTPSVQSVESFFPNSFLGDQWHVLAEGRSQISTCGQ
jgi:hypothetical protein